MPRARNGERRQLVDRERAQTRALAAAGLRRSHHVTPARAARSVASLRAPKVRW